MCFSATASFGASVLLTAIGALTQKNSLTTSQKVFGAIPLIFAAQQLCEGILWISMEQGEYYHFKKPAAYMFLFFAQVVWPTFVPASIFALEDNPLRKKLLLALLIAGIFLSSYLGYCMFKYPVRVNSNYCHIDYNLNYPSQLKFLSGFFYFMSTVVSTFISSINNIHVLGFMVIMSYLLTLFFFENYLISVWCYFAALISMLILLILKNLNSHKHSCCI